MAYTVSANASNCMDACSLRSRQSSPRPMLTVVRLSDHFGQYVLTLKCECGHTRTAQPQTLAALAGFDALLADVVKRLRCSQCGRRRCSATVRPENKRDG